MKKFIVLPYDRYISEMSNNDSQCKIIAQKSKEHSTPTELINPTSVPAYEKAVNEVTQERPIMVKHQLGGTIMTPPKPPTRKLMDKTYGVPLKKDRRPPRGTPIKTKRLAIQKWLTF